MTPDMVVALSRQAIETALFLALPMLGVSLVVGVFISVLQAATQIQEMTLTFVPKILAMFIALLLAFPWMMDKMINFTRDLFMNIPIYLR
ncbi:MAG: flagellar biosynthesis protein FliQ [Solidesulfovibrio sp.]|uniref:flagellar biosynthesis protein FliQ n=1 Tax=Solidesulfovibrio sp. TaxID=2910990 RepID=UPI002B1FD045|nr:flagellar biosynthesis protein FliQ [Solidesulfovibrio sp.]MEA4855096.1 flagellar biosynthesis protein FliQ [Solidesulfovibrio sp.]